MLYLCQDIFPPGKYPKSISRNAHYIIAFKNPRDQLRMRNLVLQAFPTCWKNMMDVYQKVTERPFGYAIPDLHPTSDGTKRVFSHLLTREGYPRWHRRIRKRILLSLGHRSLIKNKTQTAVINILNLFILIMT